MPKHLQAACTAGIELTTFDTEAELYKVKQYFPNVGLVLRIRADDPAARCNLGDKYGAEEDEIEPLMRVARDEGLNVVGISFHVGSGARDPNAFPIAVRKAREAFDLGVQYGHKMRVRAPAAPACPPHSVAAPALPLARVDDRSSIATCGWSRARPDCPSALRAAARPWRRLLGQHD